MFPTTIVIAEDLDACVPMIMIDSGSIHQAILNLCINARDAMPQGGKILLLTRFVAGALLRQRLVQAEAEHYVCISVADTGALEWKQSSGTATLNPFSPPRNRAEEAASASQ
jgi:signal transduction histidine kinase